MQKINFQDATLVTQAKVTVGGTDYEVTPATYSGGTDLDATTLNDLQDNVEASFKNTKTTSTTDGYCCTYANNTFELKPTILYKDNTGTTGTVLLSDSSANYSFIEIFYTSAYNYNSTKIYDPNGKSAYLLCGWFNGNTAGNIKIANVQINGNQITKVNHTALNYSTTNTVCIDEDQIAIKCVIGYK